MTTRRGSPSQSTTYSSADLPRSGTQDVLRPHSTGVTQRVLPEGQMLIRVRAPLVPAGIELEMTTDPSRAGVALTDLLKTAKEIKVNSILVHYLNDLK